MKKAFLGIVISVIFLYFSFSGVGYIDIMESLANVKPYFLFQALFFFIVISALKSIRWGLILSPVKKLGQRKLFPITCVGNMAVILFPFRMGEFVKPYLISNSDSIPLSASLATVFVERIMDSLCIFFIAICIFIAIDIPEWLINTGYNFLIILIILIFALVFLYINTKLGFSFFKPFSKFISDKFF